MSDEVLVSEKNKYLRVTINNGKPILIESGNFRSHGIVWWVVCTEKALYKELRGVCTEDPDLYRKVYAACTDCNLLPPALLMTSIGDDMIMDIFDKIKYHELEIEKLRERCNEIGRWIMGETPSLEIKKENTI